MELFLDKFYSFCGCCVKLLSLLLAGLIFVSCFLITCYTDDMESQTVLFRLDNPIWNLLGTVAFLALFLPFLQKKNPGRGRMLALVTVWCCAVGAVLILFGRTSPAADGMSVYAAAKELAEGRTTVIAPDNSYFSYYPQQIGLVAFYEILIRIWRLLPVSAEAYHMIKCVNILGACAILFFQEKTVHLLWNRERIDCIYLLLAGLNLPFLMYTSFVYGEIPSFAFVSAGLYCLLRFLRYGGAVSGRGWRAGVCALLCFSAGVALRKNNLIFVIAVLIVVFLQYLKERKTSGLVFVLLCAVCAFGVLPGIQKIYELRAGNYLRSGVPAAAYFAMGMQDEPGTRCGGWYNGYNFNVYQEAGLDAEAAAAVSREAIRERLKVFRENPGYAAGFYCRKELSQWADGTYASRQATWAVFGERNRLVRSLYEGDLGRVFIEYGNFYQNILYLGLLAFCMAQCRGIFRRKKESGGTRDGESGVSEMRDDGAGDGGANDGEATAWLPLWIGLIGVIGGFLFHTIWEANSRYILLYSLAMMPYSARGIYGLLERARGLGWRLCKRRAPFEAGFPRQ